MKFKDFIEFIKLPPNILAAISLVSGTILFGNDELIKRLYMTNFRNDYGFVVSTIFLISILLFTCIYKKIKNKIDNNKIRKGQIKYLLNADKAKIKIIKSFIKENTHTLRMNQNDGLTQELSYFGIISLAGNTQAVEFGYDNEMYLYYFLQPWVVELINTNDELNQKYL